MKQKASNPKGSFLLKTISFLSILGYAPAVAGWYFSPLQGWLFGIASIGFAYLWLAILMLVFFWVKKNKVVSLALFLLLIAGYAPAKVTFSLGLSKPFEVAKKENALRVMQWNCNGLPGADHTWPVNKDARFKVKTFIEAYQPDVICIQDFADYQSGKLYSNLDFLKDTLGYTYLHFAPEATITLKYGKVTTGILIASKLPLVQKGILPYNNHDFPEAIVWADILFGGKPLRIISTHFRSMHISSHKLLDPNAMGYNIKPDSALIMSPDVLQKIRHFQIVHSQQAIQLKDFIDTSSAPVVLGADLNTVPANYIYQKVKGNLQDGFLGSKTGLGATYNYLLPNLRIDYLLNDKRLETGQWKHFPEGFFDHDHLLADFEWKQP